VEAAIKAYLDKLQGTGNMEKNTTPTTANNNNNSNKGAPLTQEIAEAKSKAISSTDFPATIEYGLREFYLVKGAPIKICPKCSKKTMAVYRSGSIFLWHCINCGYSEYH